MLDREGRWSAAKPILDGSFENNIKGTITIAKNMLFITGMIDK